MGREVKIGWVTMTTGVFAGLSEPDDFLLNQAKEAIGDGLVGADGMVHPVTWIVKDSQSDSNRAAEVAGELITQDKPDIVVGGMTPVVNIPVGQQCEANGVPCITYGCPMEPWFFGMGGDPAVGFKWAYNVFWSIGDLNTVYIGLFNLLHHQQESGLPVGERSRRYRHRRRDDRLPRRHDRRPATRTSTRVWSPTAPRTSPA